MRVSGISVSDGGKTSVYLATSPDVEGASGGYYDQCAATRSSTESYDATVASRLWEVSCKMTGIAA